jgi:hypothetical protein
MRIRNRSKIKIPSELWRKIAATLGLAETLPQAVNDELGMYGSVRSLRVSINRPVPGRHEKPGAVAGSYTFGHIMLYPCPRCTPGFLTFIFLHELCHAWLHQFHERLYELYDSCGMCDEFAESAYRILGGVSMRRLSCNQFPLSLRTATARFEKFQTFAERYESLREPALRSLLGRKAHAPMTGHGR